MRYVACSGGADSVAMALLLHERGEDFELLFSDSGAELPEVFWLLPRLAQHTGKRLNVVAGATFFAYLANHDYVLPTVKKRWCNRVLKVIPQEAWLKARGDAESIAVGIRADEPKRLKKWPTPGWEIRHPLNEAGMGKADVMALCEKHDLLNPVYAWRTATSCFCCPMQTRSDWRGLLRHHPELFRVSEEWEREALARGRQGWRGQYTLADVRAEEEHPCLFG